MSPRHQDAVSIAQNFAAGIATPMALFEKKLALAEQSHYVFISFSADRIWKEAKASIQRWQNRSILSPFNGIPIAWKDLFDLKAMTTTAGSLTVDPQQYAHEEPIVNDEDLFLETKQQVLKLPTPASLLDMASISLPCGLDDQGLPVGLSLSSPAQSDAVLLSTALTIEELIIRVSII